MSTSNEIVDTFELAEVDGDEEQLEDLVATAEPEGRGIEFHVSMRDYTQRDMEALIIEAAARLLVGRRSDTEMAKAVEAKCIALVAAKADAHLAGITAEIIDQPLVPSFGAKEPVTMREFLGLTGRAYLAELVGSDGKPPTDSYYRQNSTTRMQWIVSKHMEQAFKSEIEKATNAAVREVQAAIGAKHKALIEAEKARFLAALAKAAQ